jgi:putative NIF3 family GTP cyclohydrolase 1 type 2
MEKTVQEVIETIIAAIPGAPFPETVDTLKTGNPHQVVTGIVTTFLASYQVIEQAIQLGANLIITHEPTFYNHEDEVSWLEGDPVYEAKQCLLEEHHIAIWRFHDYLHSLQPDPTTTGLLKVLGWTAYALPDKPYLCHLPARSLSDLVAALKTKLGLTTVRIVGDLEMECTKVGILVGAYGGMMQILTLKDPDLEVLLCGEIHEWETSEYVRDALQLGKRKALVVFGHAASEEPGMQAVIPWLQTRLPDLAITFIPTGLPFRRL